MPSAKIRLKKRSWPIFFCSCLGEPAKEKKEGRKKKKEGKEERRKSLSFLSFLQRSRPLLESFSLIWSHINLDLPEDILIQILTHMPTLSALRLELAPYLILPLVVARVGSVRAKFWRSLRGEHHRNSQAKKDQVAEDGYGDKLGSSPFIGEPICPSLQELEVSCLCVRELLPEIITTILSRSLATTDCPITTPPKTQSRLRRLQVCSCAFSEEAILKHPDIEECMKAGLELSFIKSNKCSFPGELSIPTLLIDRGA